MNLTDISNFISTVGFPVAMCAALLYYMNKQSEKHTNETDNLRQTIESNTKVLTELCTLIKSLVK